MDEPFELTLLEEHIDGLAMLRRFESDIDGGYILEALRGNARRGSGS
jgi:hypothetical protein